MVPFLMRRETCLIPYYYYNLVIGNIKELGCCCLKSCRKLHVYDLSSIHFFPDKHEQSTEGTI